MGLVDLCLFNSPSNHLGLDINLHCIRPLGPLQIDVKVQAYHEEHATFMR